MSSSFAEILPGARVRTAEGFLGTVERLTHAAGTPGDAPDAMLVRSEDGQWRYALPLMLVNQVAHSAFNTVVTVTLPAEQLPHYTVGSLGNERRPATVPPDLAGMPPADGEVRVPLAIEELVANKRPVLLGRVHLHKGVETVEQRLRVPVQHEEAIIERTPADQYDGSAERNPNELIIPIVEERLVVRKESVVKEYIRVRKELVTKDYEVRGTVRHEVLHVREQREQGGAGQEHPLVHDQRPEETLSPQV